MSVIGFDFGNESCFVAVARAGGIETVDNDYSLRATSSTVAFGEKHRILGVPAKNQLVTNIKNTVWGFKRLLGRSYDDPYVQEEAKRLPFQIVPHPKTRGVAVKVMYLGEQQIFSVEQIAAMLFTKLKETTESELKSKISDCVFSVPSYFTDSERRALGSAAEMAGFNVLRLLNETASTALNYGIYKQDLPEAEDKPRNVVFVDCGHSALQVWVCAFNKGKLKILATCADSYLGGRDFDKVLADHFSAEFSQKLNIDVHSNHRAQVRLLTEVEKLKKQMSANATKLPLNIECLMNDIDVSSSMCRADFEAMCSSLFDRAHTTMQECLASSGLSLSDIYSVEIVGGSTRMPAIKLLIEKVFGKAPSTTLNQDEAVARGCALQCAILSPAYKVRDFKLTDCQMYPVSVIWDEGQPTQGKMEVFPLYHSVPFSRVLTFYRKDDLKLKALYESRIPYPTPLIAEYSVKNIPPTADGGESTRLKVKARITMDGIFNICSVTAYEKCVEEVMEVEQVPQEPATNTNTEGDHETKDANATSETEINEVPMEVEGGPAGGGPQEKKVQLKPMDLPFESNSFGFSREDIMAMTEQEGKMIAEDKREKERIDAKNALEEYVYLLRDKLEGDLTQFVEDSERSSLSRDLGFLESWLYEEGSEEMRQVFVDRLDNLKKVAEPIFFRHRDHYERPNAMRELEVSIQLARKVVDMKLAKEPRYEHLEMTDIEKLKKSIQENQQWLDHTREILHSVKPHMAPPINAQEVIQQRKGFEAVVHPIMNKPKPKVESPKKEDVNAQATMENKDGPAEPTANNVPNDDEPKEMDVE